ncbi:MAG: hypothetical protein WC635_15820 [Bacteriovorax sp.]|jgi:hypothetical protein
MKTRISENTQRMLMLLKLDARRLFERIKYRAPEYMYEFSLKRSRDHFPAIFVNRYDSVSIKDLLLCGQEVLAGLDQFYTKVDEMRWYLNHTQDMPNRVEDKVGSHIRELEKLYNTLDLFIDVEMGLVAESVNAPEEITEEYETDN